MTLEQHKKLLEIFFDCLRSEFTHRNGIDFDTFERCNDEIEKLNLAKDECEYAIAKVAKIIGVTIIRA